jgi:small subunit ribosomal protein S9
MAKTKEIEKTETEEIKTAAVKPAVKKMRPAVKKIEDAVVAIEPELTVVEVIDDAALEAPEALDAAGRKKSDKYYEAVGRRKTAIARVRLYTRGDKVFLVNDKPFDQYFKTVEFKNIIEAPLVKMNCTDRFRITARVMGGGVIAQAEALRHGITRALVMFNADFKKRLKKSGYLTRDPRMKERKKPGLKKARRAPQWAKR